MRAGVLWGLVVLHCVLLASGILGDARCLYHWLTADKLGVGIPRLGGIQPVAPCRGKPALLANALDEVVAFVQPEKEEWDLG